jgi:hypothetical protein
MDAWRNQTIGCHLANEVTDCGVNSRSTGMPLLKKRGHLLTKSYVLNNQVGARSGSRPQDADGK